MSDLVLSVFLGQMIEKQIALDMRIGYYLSIKKMVQMLGISGCFGLLLKKSINQSI